MEPNRGSTVDEYDTAQAAVALSRAVKQEGKKGIYFGVFYMTRSGRLRKGTPEPLPLLPP